MTHDPGLEAYVEAIEAHLRARRGTDQVLSPRDFALARAWHAAGIPLATVLVGVDRAFDAEPAASSLAFCRRFVEELTAAGPPPRSRPAAGSASVRLDEVQAVLAALLEGLDRLRPGPQACFEPPLGKAREVLDLIAVASRPNWDYVRRKLQEIDDDVSAAVLQALSPEETEAFRKDAARAVERHRGRVDGEALQDAMARYLAQKARERLGLPRVSLI